MSNAVLNYCGRYPHKSGPLNIYASLVDISLTSNNILFAITISGVMFAIYRSYRDPQTNSDRTDAIMGVRIDNLQTAMDKILSNHLPHLDAKIEDIHGDISQLKTTVTQLATVIEERIPRRKGE